MIRYTTPDFVAKAREVHGNKYSYEKTVYNGSQKRLIVTCPIHGDFTVIAGNHLRGNGCRKCAIQNQWKDALVCGVGFLDLKTHTRTRPYIAWSRMLKRCYDSEFHQKAPSYIGCSVCEEWLIFSNFKAWFDENYIEGYELDKDILVKGNKVYSPDTCCFVPHRINTLILNPLPKGSYPIGVTKVRNKFWARCNTKSQSDWIGSYNTAEEAFLAYKETREMYVKKYAKEYYNKQQISEQVYEALINWTL